MEISREHELMEINHLGNGVVLFSGAIQATDTEIASFMGNSEKNTPNQNYRQVSKTEVENDGGYKFDPLDNPSPSRFMNLIYVFIHEMSVSLFKQTRHYE